MHAFLLGFLTGLGTAYIPAIIVVAVCYMRAPMIEDDGEDLEETRP